MAAWSSIEIFSVLLFILTFCFTVVYVEKKVLSWWEIILIFIPLVPVGIFANTELYLEGYDAQECVAIENELYIQYVRAVKILYALATLGYLVVRLCQSKYAKSRAEISILTIGIASFIYSFLIAGYISENTENYTYEIYGVFGIAIFIASLSYLIVKYSAFNVKLVAAQALVSALTLLVGAQAFFYSSKTELVIKALTALLVAIFGFFLIRSVKKETREKERNIALANDLAKANVRLQELDKLKTEFVSIASHQLRSPLTAIRGYASLITDGTYGPFPEKIREPLNRIEDSSRFMALSIDDFLNVSRIESGSMKYEKSTFSLKELASRLADDLRPTAMKKGIVLMFRSDAETDMKVSADNGKLRQVIQNVVDNALKYTPKGTVSIVAQEDVKAKKARIIVVDTGVGMSEETQKSLFGKFVRAKNANTVNVFGTGLGLYIGKQMLEAMGGTLTATSKGEDKGSTFTIELPLAK
jgi:signal transduction histidine kinase